MEASNVIFTKHPEGKKGAALPKNDYYQICESILYVLQQEEKITFNELIDEVQRRLAIGLINNIAWRILVVKLDLEAKGLIKVTPHKYDRHVVHLKLNRRAWKKLYGPLTKSAA
jgi:hypothetical protein